MLQLAPAPVVWNATVPGPDLERNEVAYPNNFTNLETAVRVEVRSITL